MQEKNRKAFLVLMAMLSEAFKEEVSTERAKIYFEFLSKYELNHVVYAIKQAIRELKWFPKIAELIEFINPCLYPEMGDPERLTYQKKEGDKRALEYISEIAKMIGEKKDINRLVKLPYKQRASGEKEMEG